MTTKTHQILLLLIVVILSSCKNESIKNKNITSVNDYNNYLILEAKEPLALVEKELTFWTQKYENAPNQSLYLGKVASAQTQKFMVTGNIDALLESEEILLKLNEKTKYSNASYLRALARNYISQHKFKEALMLLSKAEANGRHLKATQKMLFDVHLELGNTEKAVSYLEVFKNFSDFDYLIRLSKYNDHKGDLDNAITYLEKALVIAEASNLDATKQWTYTNLADYYGHAGRIMDSYQHYLKALAIDGDDAYAKKGIAWIVYSYERNPQEALRILNSVMSYNQSPDYYLLKSEIAEFMNNNIEKESNLVAFKNAIANAKYGAMYNAYKIELLNEELKASSEVIALAQEELFNRATPQTYDLLAWSYFKQGDARKSLEIMEKHVINKTFEPVAMYHLAEIYKANGNSKEAQKLKLELLEAAFELGPVLEQTIEKI